MSAFLEEGKHCTARFVAAYARSIAVGNAFMERPGTATQREWVAALRELGEAAIALADHDAKELPDEDEQPFVCPGCHAFGEESCRPGCIDAEIAADHETHEMYGDPEPDDDL